MGLNSDGGRRAGLGECLLNQFRLAVEGQRVLESDDEAIRFEAKFKCIQQTNVDDYIHPGGSHTGTRHGNMGVNPDRRIVGSRGSLENARTAKLARTAEVGQAYSPM